MFKIIDTRDGSTYRVEETLDRAKEVLEKVRKRFPKDRASFQLREVR